MPLPLLAAAAAPEILKVLSAAGASKDVCIIDGIYQPMIKVGKGKDKKEIPNPRWPTGLRVAIPAWFFLLAALLGVSVGSLLILEAQGKLGGVKEALGIKKKQGALGMGFMGL